LRFGLWSIAFVVAALAAVRCAAPVLAETEFCPATLSAAHKQTVQDTNEFAYWLQALGARTVAATIVADTNEGWFTWEQQPVQLTPTKFTAKTRDYAIRFEIARSPELRVNFPLAVEVRRAWVVSAKTTGDETFGWDAQGVVTCRLPDLANFDTVTDGNDTETLQPGDPTPGPAPPPALATRAPAPFPDTTCKKPFESAQTLTAQRPNLPAMLVAQGFDEPAQATVYVVVSPDGNVADAWVFSSSGYPSLDAETLKAAQRSTYSPAVSYCKPVAGIYLFSATFQP
jgi:TonB family protein